MGYTEYEGRYHNPKCPDCHKSLWRWWDEDMEEFYCTTCQQWLTERQVVR